MGGGAEAITEGAARPERDGIRWPLPPGPAALAVLSLALVVCFILSIAWGVAPLDVLTILLDALGLPVDADFLARDRAVILAIRLPRALLGLAAGAGLAIARAAMQGLFRNPLADPALIGVSTRAALGAVAALEEDLEQTCRQISRATARPEGRLDNNLRRRERRLAAARARIRSLEFGSLHALFLEIYEDHFGAQDDLAERIRALDAHAEGRFAEYLRRSTVKECDGKIKAADMVANLQADQEAISGTLTALAALAEKHGDMMTNDLAIERGRAHDKFAWMLRAHLKG